MIITTRIILAFLLLINAVPCYAQDYASRSREEKKLDSETYELLKLAEAADSSREANQRLYDHLRLDESLKADSMDRIRITIELTSVDGREDVIKFIESVDGSIVKVYKSFPCLVCQIHPKELRGLASLSSVLRIRISAEGVTR
jgi:hypothetical protein